MEASIAAIKQDIIIKCPLKEMVKRFFKDYVIVWHDPHLSSQENRQYIVDLERFCKVHTFTEWDKASIYIRNTRKICYLITSGTKGEFLVREICSQRNICNIYVFCMNRDYHSNWTKNYQKISCVETEIEAILEKIEEDLLDWYQEESSLEINLPAFAPVWSEEHKNKVNNLHRFLKVIPNFQNREQAKNDFTLLSREIYSDKGSRKEIVEFEQDYSEYDMKKVFRWYTKESFLYKVTNNCLRIATLDSIQYCRLPLRDMQRAIKEQYQKKSKNFSGLLYRAAPLDEEEWQILKDNKGREIEMHGFLSTSKVKGVALKYMDLDSFEKVFITIIVPKGLNEEEQGFAEVKTFSKYSKEKEVLFNVRSRFTVLETEESYSEELKKNLRHLVLLYGAQGFRSFLAARNHGQEVLNPQTILCVGCKNTISDVRNKFFFLPLSIGSDNYYCRECLPKFTEFSDDPLLCLPAIDYRHQIKIKGCVLTKRESKIPFYGYQCIKCKISKKEEYFVCTDCEKTKSQWCKECFENASDCLSLEHTVILETSPFSFWYDQMSTKEVNHLRTQNDIVFQSSKLQHAKMYCESGEFEKAIEFYKIYLNENKAEHRDGELAAYMNRIQEEYENASENCLKSQDSNRNSFAEEISAASFDSLAALYSQQGKFSKALDCYSKSLKIKKELYGKTHPIVATSYNDLGILCHNQREYEKALEYHRECLEIRKSSFPVNHYDLADSYDKIGATYFNQEEYEKAREFYMDCLNIRKVLCGEYHSSTADLYDKIGTIFFNQKKYEQALDSHSKCLNIRELNPGNNQNLIADSYDKIWEVYFYQSKYAPALKYGLKCLEIRREIDGDNGIAVADSYHCLGTTYFQQGEYKEAIDYFSKSLEIKKSKNQDNQKILADLSYNIELIQNLLSNKKK